MIANTGSFDIGQERLCSAHGRFAHFARALSAARGPRQHITKRLTLSCVDERVRHENPFQPTLYRSRAEDRTRIQTADLTGGKVRQVQTPSSAVSRRQELSGAEPRRECFGYGLRGVRLIEELCAKSYLRG